jgi:hypothetical protein
MHNDERTSHRSAGRFTPRILHLWNLHLWTMCDLFGQYAMLFLTAPLTQNAAFSHEARWT